MAEQKLTVKLKKLNLFLHKYLGYFFLGMIIVYSISGIAFNHAKAWNPNYKTIEKVVTINPIKNQEEISKQELEKIFLDLDIREPVDENKIFYPSPNTIQILLDKNDKLMINTLEKKATYQTSKKRIIYPLNFFHLNIAKGFWTFYADIFALGLIIIAITGMFLENKKKGLLGKGGLVMIAGIIFPFILMLFYYK